MKLKYLSLLLSIICIMQFMTVPSFANAQAMEIKSNLAIDGEDIKDTAEYKGYLWRIDAKDDDCLEIFVHQRISSKKQVINMELMLIMCLQEKV